jgi:hypothetical protein
MLSKDTYFLYFLEFVTGACQIPTGQEMIISPFCALRSTYLLDVLWGQLIKLAQVASISELLENQWNDLVFFKIIPSHFCRASEASKIDCFKN